ncbi:MAG: hypothetical protein LBV27_06560, partial [Oscillospiraceae bacterium]|nr:hypothetical protein [Oscillospiraceae bacterium]
MDIYPPINGKISYWHMIIAGSLKWNRYFGESSDNPPRGDPIPCTSILISGGGENGNDYHI